MTTTIGIIIGAVAGCGVGVALSYTLLKKAITNRSQDILRKAESDAKALKKKSEEDAELLKKEKMLQAKEKFLQLKAEHEKTVNARNQELSNAENRLKQKENTLNQKLEDANRKINENNTLKEKLNRQIEIITILCNIVLLWETSL